jgi:hypothetical protein
MTARCTSSADRASSQRPAWPRPPRRR